MRDIDYPFVLDTRWREEPLTNIDSLSQAKDTITIRLPQDDYTRLGIYSGTMLENVVVDATFTIKETVVGTPSSAVSRLRSRSIKAGELLRYVEGNNSWLLGREMCALNGLVAYLSLPTSPRKVLIDTSLMVCSSRMSKLIKEKVIPALIFYEPNIIVRITNISNCITQMGVAPTKPVSKDDIRDMLLTHANEIV